MTLSVALIITVVALVLSALFSGSEIAFVQSDKVKMEIDASRNGITDKIIHLFSRHESMFISTMLVGNNIVLVVYGITISFIINPILESWFSSKALVLVVNTLFSTGIVLMAGEFLPKTAFRINPNFMIRLFALPLFLVYWILYPVSLLVAAISKGMMKIFGLQDKNENQQEGITIDELDDYLQNQIEEVDDRKQVENEVKIFRNAIDFKDTQIGECMIPRNEIVAVGLDQVTREDLIKKFTATGLSKIIVYKKDIDDILGYIHVSELFNIDSDWKTRLKPVIFCPEAMLANKMMQRMLSEKRSVAVIIDEFGGTAGLATLEDLVEEIFGDIEDEHDRHRQLSREVSPGIYEASGREEISRLNEEFNLDIPEEEDFHTLSGYILEELGTLPKEGESFERDGVKFTILKMTATRILTVRIETGKESE